VERDVTMSRWYEKFLGARRSEAPAIAAPVTPAAAPQPVTELEKFFRSLVRLEYLPRHVVDVGANRGDWTRLALHNLPDARYKLFETNPRLHGLLADLASEYDAVTVHPVGVGSVDGELPFTLHERDDSGTFSMTLDQATREGFGQVAIPIRRLDDVLRGAAAPPVDLLKVDAEGFDLEVLAGAPETLEAAEIVLVECAVMSKRFSNDVRSVVNYMHSNGFHPLDITDINRTQKHGSLWLIEMAFVKAGGSIDGRVDSYS
jgi:FkbM family methyltransferase